MFANLYENCVQKKDRYITFQFQWHQHCSILLVTDSLDLAKLNLHPEDNATNTELSWHLVVAKDYLLSGMEH